MRVSEKQQVIIKKLAKQEFGEDTHVYIFGSRLYNSKKGGDIDLFITNQNKQKLTLKSKIRFLARLKSFIGDQKIDVVLDTKATKSKKSFYQSIKKDAVEI
jgi:predicted nucleotidyltransferase